MKPPAVFIDRDGVLIEDIGLLTEVNQVKFIKDAPKFVYSLKKRGYLVIAVTNQTVIARGLATEQDVEAVNTSIQQMLVAAGGLPVDAFYYCPHHPNATLPQYRLACECRKPRPGLILKAAYDYNVDLARSYMVGDRLTDALAGFHAGCKTILVETGRHNEPLIESPDSIDISFRPDFICAGLNEVIKTVLDNSR